MRDLGTYERNGDHIDVRFERHYPRPPETVWKALTDPARLADWMGRSPQEVVSDEVRIHARDDVVHLVP